MRNKSFGMKMTNSKRHVIGSESEMPNLLRQSKERIQATK
jgi:hypothetical protein